MKLREAMAILGCWIMAVLLCWEINHKIIYEKSYTVSQSGVGTDYSLETFAQVSGPHPDTTYYLMGTFTKTIEADVWGMPGRFVTLQGGYFDFMGNE